MALLYAVIGTWLTHLIGKPLIKLDFNQEKYEATSATSCAPREYGEQVALLRGETAERQHIGSRFGAIVSNYYGLVKQNLKLNSLSRPTSSCRWLSPTSSWRRPISRAS